MGKGSYTGGSTIIQGDRPKISNRARQAARQKSKDSAIESQWLKERNLAVRKKPPTNGPRNS